jgi:hypothetical protein
MPEIVVSREPSNKPPAETYVQASTRKRFWIHVAHATVFIIGLGLPLGVFLPMLSNVPDEYYDTACYQISSEGWFSGGSFSVILNIDIGYRNLSFGVAKLVGLVWDIIISRGGQIFLAR